MSNFEDPKTFSDATWNVGKTYKNQLSGQSALFNER